MKGLTPFDDLARNAGSRMSVEVKILLWEWGRRSGGCGGRLGPVPQEELAARGDGEEGAVRGETDA